MPVRSFYVAPDNTLRTNLDASEIASRFRGGEGLLWVDVSETVPADGQFMSDVFGFHPLAIEDCVDPELHPPKVEDFRDYLFFVVHGISHGQDSELVETTEMALFLGRSFVVSNHNLPLYSVEAIVQRITADPAIMARGADFLAHLLIDALVDNIMPAVDRLTEVADHLDAAALRTPDPAVLEVVRNLKRSTMRIYRVMVPQRELLNRVSRREYPLIRDEHLVYFRDTYDRMVRIGDLLQIVRETADAAVANYMSAIGVRQNESMRRLSVIAAIFLPLTLLAGIYGMNFENMPELTWSWGYFAVIAVMGATILCAVIWLGALRWALAGRRRFTRGISLAVSPERLVGYTGRVLHPRHLRGPAQTPG